MGKHGILNQSKKQWKKLSSHMDSGVFIPSALLVLVFVTLGATYTQLTLSFFDTIHRFIASWFGYYYSWLLFFLLLLCLVLVFTPWSKKRFGGRKARPKFSRMSWYTMLFSAGMGAGMLFWGVAEPITHFTHPPDVASWMTLSPKEKSLLFSFFHWGLHPWAVYTIFALGIAFFHYNKNLPLAPRSLLAPVIGETKINGLLGKSFDVICTVGTLFGVSTSLGLGAMQLNSGIMQFSDVAYSKNVQVTIVLLVTAVATVSVASGISKGIRLLSVFNIALLFLFACTVAILIVDIDFALDFVKMIGIYLAHLPSLSFFKENDLNWQRQWTLFYWGWWISWCPFVGIFVARISKGRAIRDFILSTLLVPAGATTAWLMLLGSTAVQFSQTEPNFTVKEMIATPAKSLHLFTQSIPFGGVLSIVATMMIFLFFVTSSDSGSLVDDIVTSGGDPHPPVVQRIFWALSEGGVALVLLLFGGLKGLQMATITVALPMSILLTIAAFGLIRESLAPIK